MNFSEVIAHHAERFAARPALSTAEQEVTYAELRDRMHACAGALRELGVGRGDVVGVLLYNRLELLDLLCACAHLGAIFMPLNWRLTGPELAYIVDHAQAAVVVSEPELEARLAAVREAPAQRRWVRIGAAGDGWLSLAGLIAAAAPVADAEPVDGDDVMRLMYTSGTTARPKGVMITHANLLWKCTAHVVELEMHAGDRGLACGPLYHVGALDMTTTNMLYVGASTHLLPRFDVVPVLEEIERRKITNLWLAPAMVNALLASDELGRRDLRSVRLLLDGGEKMPLPLIERVTAAFPNAWFGDAYGLTETVSGDTYLDKGALLDKLGSVGKPVMHTRIRVVDPEGRPVPAGEHGEIVVSGPKVCKGYWRDPEATAAALRDGWLHTGDVGMLDEDGYLFVVDRLKDMIVSGGENIASPEVERVLYEHPAVLEAAVVGAPDPRWNEVPVAYVVLREGAEAEPAALDAFCRERLAAYKTPKAFRFVDALPRNPSGKVLKRVLRDREPPTDDERPA